VRHLLVGETESDSTVEVSVADMVAEPGCWFVPLRLAY